MKTINYRHVDFCNRMPLPAELAREYLAHGRSFGKMASFYDCSPNSIRHRVLFGMELLGQDENCQPETVEPAGPSDDKVEELPVHRCACEIILKTPRQQKRGTCDFCAGVAFDYMAFRQAETAVAGSIPMDVSLSI